LVRLLTWNGQSVIGYHTWTELSSNAVIIAILLSFTLYVFFPTCSFMTSRSNQHVKNSQPHPNQLQHPYIASSQISNRDPHGWE
jgi:hypothetical protein